MVLQNKKILTKPVRALARPKVRFFAGLVVIAGLVLGVSSYWFIQHSNRYNLGPQEKQLLSKVTVKPSMTTFEKGVLSYNSQDEKKADKNTITLASALDSSNSKQTYTAKIPADPTQGITIADSNNTIPLKMTPLTSSAEGMYIDGRMIYPTAGGKSVYTLKKNGIKEDIVVSSAPRSGSLLYQWRLDLGDKLEAKLLPDGGVGFYSANPLLSDPNLQVGDAKSQQLLDKAKQNAQKDTLVYLIPKPYFKDSAGKVNDTDTKFKLNGNILSLETTNLKLKTIKYPITIDPSTAVVTTTGDFQAGYDDGNLDYSTSGQIKRGAISLGSVGASTRQGNAFTSARSTFGSVAYKGFLYIAGGIDNGGSFNDIQYCPLNSNGSVGTCTQQTNAFTTARYSLGVQAYNNYLYIIGGYSGTGGTGCSGGYCTDIQYCPINTNGSVGTCTQQTGLLGNNIGFSTVVYNGYIYQVGGSSSQDIKRCPINGDGSVGSCTNQATILNSTRGNASAVAYNGFIYAIGGTSGGYNSSIEYCPINSDGSIGSCTQQNSAFSPGRLGHTSTVSNGHLYIMGGQGSGTGCDGTNYCNDLEYCPINSNGSVGTCTQQTNAFLVVRADFGSAVYNGYIYVIGGYNNGYLNDISRMPVDSGTPSFGTIGSSTQQTNAFTTGRRYHASVVYNGYLYIIGGDDGTFRKNDIQYCPINSNGSIGSCTVQSSAFPNARRQHTAVTYNGYLYIIGGDVSGSPTGCSSGYCNDIIYCPINSNGSIGSCTQQTSAFTTVRGGHASTIYNGYLYILGGYNGSYLRDIQHCPINSNGSVGTCVQQTNAFTTTRALFGASAYNGYLYLAGGFTGGGTDIDDIQYCPINNDGSVGTCTQQTSAFTTARDEHAVLTYNNYLYIIGGEGTGTGCTSSRCNDVQSCPINSNGSVGTCTQTTSAFTTGRTALASVAYSGNLYMIGGLSTSTYLNDVERTPTKSPEQASTYERIIDTGSLDYNIQSISYHGKSICGMAINYKLAGSNGIFGSNNVIAFTLPDNSYTINQSARYIWVQFKLNDAVCGTTSNITDFTITYAAYPAAPILVGPPASATNISANPKFILRTTDSDGDYLKYYIQLYDATACGGSLVTIADQTSSQTGWSGQDQQSNTAYAGNVTIGNSTVAIYSYTGTPLISNHTYSWRAKAIDPGGSNTWSSLTSCQDFTTGASEAQIQGGVTIQGGTIIQ